MNQLQTPTATFLLSCQTQKGLVAKVSQFLYEHGADITHADHHIDPEAGIFFMRVEWRTDAFDLDPAETSSRFGELAEKLEMQWQLHYSSQVQRVALFVSKQDHCLLDILWRYRAGEFPNVEIPILISNHLHH